MSAEDFLSRVADDGLRGFLRQMSERVAALERGQPRGMKLSPPEPRPFCTRCGRYGHVELECRRPEPSPHPDRTCVTCAHFVCRPERRGGLGDPYTALLCSRGRFTLEEAYWMHGGAREFHVYNDALPKLVRRFAATCPDYERAGGA